MSCSSSLVSLSSVLQEYFKAYSKRLNMQLMSEIKADAHIFYLLTRDALFAPGKTDSINDTTPLNTPRFQGNTVS